MGKIADATRTWTVGIEQRRQLLAFDTELEEAKAERDRFQAQNLALQSKVQPLQEEVERLHKRVQEESAKAERAEKLAAHKANKVAPAEPEAEHLDETRVQILKVLAVCQMKDSDLPTTRGLAKFLKVNEIRASSVLRELRKEQYIGCNNDGEWYLRERGEDYLVRYNHA